MAIKSSTTSAVSIVNPPEDAHGRHVGISLLLLAAPVIAAMISRTVMSFVDFVMVSQLGTAAQAAILPAGILLWCPIGFGYGMAGVVNTFVSQSLGKKRPTDCTAYAWQGIYLSCGLGLIVLPAWFIFDSLFHWIGHGEDVVYMEVIYAKIGILAVAPIVGARAVSSFFTGMHRPLVGLVAAVVSNVFNVIANYALIFGHWGFPHMGIAGAAWATLAASLLEFVLLLGWMLRPQLARSFHSRRTWRVNRELMVNLLRVGAPMGMQVLVDIGAWMVFTLFLVGQFGKFQLAAHNICLKILELSFMPAVGLSHALTAAVGKSIGQNRLDLARQNVRWCLLYTIGYMGLVGLTIGVFRYSLPGLFTEDHQVTRWAGPIMICCALYQIFDALTITFTGALRGAGDTAWPVFAYVTSAAVVMIGGGLLMTKIAVHWQCIGVWIPAMAHMVLMGVVLGLRYRFGPWESLKLGRDS